MFQFPVFAMHDYGFIVHFRVSQDRRSFDNSPELIAVFHALRRLSVPRHPPHALTSLTTPFSPSAPAGPRTTPLARSSHNTTWEKPEKGAYASRRAPRLGAG